MAKMHKISLVTLSLAVCSSVFAKLPGNSTDLAQYATQLQNGNPSPVVNRAYAQPQLIQSQASTVNTRTGFTTAYFGLQRKEPVQVAATNQVAAQAVAVNTAHAQPVQGQQVLTQPDQSKTYESIARMTLSGNNRATYYTPQVSYSQPTGISTSYVKGRVADLNCVMAVAKNENVPLYVFLGIHSMERGKNGQTVGNKNKSLDMGQFQVNTIHFNRGGVYSHIDRNHATTDGCFNAALAAKLLKMQLSQTNRTNDFWTRAAAYHSWTPSYNAKYKVGLIKYSNDWKAWLLKKGINPN